MPARWTQHAGARIYVVDYSGMTNRDEIVRLIWESAREIQRQPPKSVRVLMLVAGAQIDGTVAAQLREAGLGNAPHLKGVAVVGLTGIMKILQRTMSLLMRQEIPHFATDGEAMEWLVRDA
jgi:hypothetical protein